MDGYVYILANKYVPTLVKIGYTDRDPHVRAAELSGTTGVPGQWAVKRYWLLENAFRWEQTIFAALRSHRETGEFFRLRPDVAIAQIEALLLEEGAIDATGVSSATRRAQAREQQRILGKQQELIAEQDRQRQFDAAWEQGWAFHVQPWSKLVQFCIEQKKTYSPPGLIHKMMNGKIDVASALMHWAIGLPRTGQSSEIIQADVEFVPHLRKWHGYPRLLALLPEMFAASRRAREFILRLSSQYGRRTPSKWSEYWRDGQWQYLLYGNPETWQTLEVRMLTQRVFGLSGDAATALLQSEPTVLSTLRNLATNAPPPESRYANY